MRGLRVSDNKRFLVTDDGKPFFFLGDTAWELLHRLKMEEAEHYLSVRAKQGYNVIQAVAIAEFEGLTVPNPNGDLPLEGQDPAKPVDVYFRHVDRIVEAANKKGMYIGFLPTWGDKVNKKWGGGPEIFTPANARVYGEFLGRRYRDAGLIWILGGDRPIETDTHLEIWRQMVAGIRAGGAKQLMTYHPMGWQSSSQKLHKEPWLDFNMLQSGHGAKVPENYKLIAADYAMEPTKPCMDAEPCYEDHPVNWKPDELGWFDEYEVRRAAYWSVFTGSHGHTYGCHDVWQMWDKSREPVAWARTPWQEAIELPGARQMRHLKELMLSKPFLTRIPDQSLIAGQNPDGEDHVVATRDTEGTYALLYFPTPRPFNLDLSKLAGDSLRVRWFDPRTGESSDGGTIRKDSSRQIERPKEGRDWVLVIEKV